MKRSSSSAACARSSKSGRKETASVPDCVSRLRRFSETWTSGIADRTALGLAPPAILAAATAWTLLEEGARLADELHGGRAARGHGLSSRRRPPSDGLPPMAERRGWGRTVNGGRRLFQSGTYSRQGRIRAGGECVLPSTRPDEERPRLPRRKRGLPRKALAATYSPVVVTVPSALQGLTALFGMGRGVALAL